MTRATIDFETYSEAGYVLTPELKWKGIQKSKTGIAAVGAPAYAYHPSTECLCLSYDLHDGAGVHQWMPAFGEGPKDLFDHLAAGGSMEAHNASFEYFVWKFTMVPKYGWPEVDVSKFECSAAKCRAYGLPGSLEKAGAELMTQGKIPREDLKSKRGMALIRLLSIPHTPTKNKPWLRNEPFAFPDEYMEMIDYCDQDVVAEASISAVVPPLHPFESEVYHLDAAINARGVRIDVPALKACQKIVNATIEQQTKELISLTEGRVQTAGQVAVILKEVNSLGLNLEACTKDIVADEIKRLKALIAPGSNVPLAKALRILEIRAALSSASVKKIPAMLSRVCDEERIHGLFQYYGAATGRFAGRGPQPQNLPSKGPWKPWEVSDVDMCLYRAANDAQRFTEYYPDPLAAISGCLRGMFIPKEGYDFISSDYSAIEAVTLAHITKEQWRIDAFAEGKDIYLMSAAQITGKDYEELAKDRSPEGDYIHPLRKGLGKVAELASGYQGSVGAWKAFGADKFMDSDEEILENVRAWRAKSPRIVAFWYGVEDAMVKAIRFGKAHYGGFDFFRMSGALHIRLLSGRCLVYQRAEVKYEMNNWGKLKHRIFFWSHNSDSTKGPVGWTQGHTYGGKITENINQATARDIMCNAMMNLEKHGYPTVLHVHDESVGEVPEGFGSVEEYEAIMAIKPDWCSDWHIKASGGWRGKRYRKG